MRNLLMAAAAILGAGMGIGREPDPKCSVPKALDRTPEQHARMAAEAEAKRARRAKKQAEIAARKESK